MKSYVRVLWLLFCSNWSNLYSGLNFISITLYRYFTIHFTDFDNPNIFHYKGSRFQLEVWQGMSSQMLIELSFPHHCLITFGFVAFMSLNDQILLYKLDIYIQTNFTNHVRQHQLGLHNHKHDYYKTKLSQNTTTLWTINSAILGLLYIIVSLQLLTTNVILIIVDKR